MPDLVDPGSGDPQSELYILERLRMDLWAHTCNRHTVCRSVKRHQRSAWLEQSGAYRNLTAARSDEFC